MFLLVFEGLLHHLKLINILHNHTLNLFLLLVSFPNAQKVRLCFRIQATKNLLHRVHFQLLLILFTNYLEDYLMLSCGV